MDGDALERACEGLLTEWESQTIGVAPAPHDGACCDPHAAGVADGVSRCGNALRATLTRVRQAETERAMP
jgi:hypothetical protein